MADEAGHSGHTQTDDNSQSSGDGGANVRVIIGDSAAKWIVIVLLAFACAYAVARSESANSTAEHAYTEARLSEYEVGELKEWNVEHGLGIPSSLKKEPKK